MLSESFLWYCIEQYCTVYTHITISFIFRIKCLFSKIRGTIKETDEMKSNTEIVHQFTQPDIFFLFDLKLTFHAARTRQHLFC